MGLTKISAVRQVSAGNGRFMSKYIENGDFQPSLRDSQGESIIGRELDSTLKAFNVTGLWPKKISDLWV